MSPVQAEDGPLLSSDLGHQSMLGDYISVPLSSRKPFYKDCEQMEQTQDYGTTVNQQKLQNEDNNLSSYINRMNFMGAVLKQASASNLIKLENNCEVLDLSLRPNHSDVFVERKSFDNECTSNACNEDETIDGAAQVTLPMQTSQQTLPLLNPPGEVQISTPSGVSSEHHPGGGDNIEFNLNPLYLSKWEELFRNLDATLRQLQQELSIRNYIERNRVCLDLAKFQFQNPSFQYKW